MTSSRSISILGCGWLGLPLARQLAGRQWQVKGSTTRPEKLSVLSDNHVQPYLIQLGSDSDKENNNAFFQSEVLLVNVPPGRSNPAAAQQYPAQMRQVAAVAAQQGVQKVLFVSSTSVYPNLNRVVTEQDADPAAPGNGQAIWQAERCFTEHHSFQTTVVRFCGLYGPARNPGRFLAGKVLSTSGDAGVNLIHQQDCIQIIIRLLEENIWGEVFNACADQHPAKNVYYPKVAQQAGLPVPTFTGTEPEDFKIVDSHKLKERLQYQFSHPDPLQSL